MNSLISLFPLPFKKRFIQELQISYNPNFFFLPVLYGGSAAILDKHFMVLSRRVEEVKRHYIVRVAWSWLCILFLVEVLDDGGYCKGSGHDGSITAG